MRYQEDSEAQDVFIAPGARTPAQYSFRNSVTALRGGNDPLPSPALHREQGAEVPRGDSCPLVRRSWPAVGLHEQLIALAGQEQMCRSWLGSLHLQHPHLLGGSRSLAGIMAAGTGQQAAGRCPEARVYTGLPSRESGSNSYGETCYQGPEQPHLCLCVHPWAAACPWGHPCVPE